MNLDVQIRRQKTTEPSVEPRRFIHVSMTSPRTRQHSSIQPRRLNYQAQEQNFLTDIWPLILTFSDERPKKNRNCLSHENIIEARALAWEMFQIENLSETVEKVQTINQS